MNESIISIEIENEDFTKQKMEKISAQISLNTMKRGLEIFMNYMDWGKLVTNCGVENLITNPFWNKGRVLQILGNYFSCDVGIEKGCLSTKMSEKMKTIREKNE